MSDSKVVIVHLRQPNQKDKEKEMRSDPFYEFGSFGCTGCHNKNLMNPKKIEQLDGVRLAFAQGGPEGFKLILLTPLVTHVKHKYRCELKWKPDGTRFFKYENAPLLINNAGHSDFPLLKKMLQKVKRPTLVAKFSSKFRTRRESLPNDVASKMIDKYLHLRTTAKKEHFTRNYVETMHERPPKKDNNRAKTYAKFLHKANSVKSCKCKQKPY
jgi:hypothetical protein